MQGSVVYDDLAGLKGEKRLLHKDWAFHLLNEMFKRAKAEKVDKVVFQQDVEKGEGAVPDHAAERRLKKFAEMAMRHGFQVLAERRESSVDSWDSTEHFTPWQTFVAERVKPSR